MCDREYLIQFSVSDVNEKIIAIHNKKKNVNVIFISNIIFIFLVY